MSGVTDPYQPLERRLGLTRACLEVLLEARNPVTVVTKGAGIVRDVDLLGALARHDAAAALLSVTSLDPELARNLEPRAASPQRRLAAIRALSGAGIPVGVLVAPIIPGLNDREVPAILAAAAEAGATFAGRVMLRLPHGVAGLFGDWLARHRPREKAKVLARLRAMRGGRLYAPEFGARMSGAGPYAKGVDRLFDLARERHGLARHAPELSVAAFRPPDGQLRLFDGD